jgi:hypothetical protein
LIELVVSALPPPPEPPFDAVEAAPQFDAPLPPPEEVIELKTELDPEVEAVVFPPPVPPAPTVTV